MPCIYKITNNVNGKVYIGQTIKTTRVRLTEHKYIANHPKYDHRSILHSAMRKYGCDNFTIETIQECSEDQLNELEKYWIEQYDSFKNGYNCTLGGDGGNKRARYFAAKREYAYRRRRAEHCCNGSGHHRNVKRVL